MLKNVFNYCYLNNNKCNDFLNGYLKKIYNIFVYLMVMNYLMLNKYNVIFIT